MNDEQLVILLKAIQRVALVPYPFSNDDPCDPELVLALGEIAGRAGYAIDLHKKKAADHAR